MSATIVANTVDEIYRAVDKQPSHIIVQGDFSQQISKGMNAYHKYKAAQARAAAAGAGAVGGLCLGPAGWILGAGCCAAMILAVKSKEEAKKAFRAAPHSLVVEYLADAKYEILSNNYTEIRLSKR